MLTLEMSYKLLQTSFDSLEQDGAMGAKVLLTKDTVVLGPGSPLDSIGDQDEQAHERAVDQTELSEHQVYLLVLVFAGAGGFDRRL